MSNPKQKSDALFMQHSKLFSESTDVCLEMGQVKFKGNTLRVYPDLSTALAKKHAMFNPMK